MRKSGWPTYQERLIAKLTVDDKSGCHIWTGSINNKGYGTIYALGRQHLVHRLSWLITHGELDSKILVLHKCDTPRCVNVDHLFLGSQKDNMRDMRSKGRHATAKQTKCKNGHELVKAKTQRICMTCSRLAKSKYRKENRDKHLSYMREYNKHYERKTK